jgi:transcription elongation factor
MEKIMLNTGNIVKIKQEFLNPNEDVNDLYVVREFNGDRVIISPTTWNGRIVPTELVRT